MKTNFNAMAKRFSSWSHKDYFLYFCNGFSALRYETDQKPDAHDGLEGGLSERASGENFDRLHNYMVETDSQTWKVSDLRKLAKSLKKTAKVNRHNIVAMTLAGQWANIPEQKSSDPDSELWVSPAAIITALTGLTGEVEVVTKQNDRFNTHLFILQQDGFKAILMGMNPRTYLEKV